VGWQDEAPGPFPTRSWAEAVASRDTGDLDEPSLAIFGMREGCIYFLDCEYDPAESGIGDLDSLEVQIGRPA
jgi:hypothetical protein